MTEPDPTPAPPVPAAAPIAPDPTRPVVMTVDIGGSHVKIMTSAEAVEHRDVSGPTMNAAAMVEKVKALSAGIDYDVISIGYPGPVAHDRVLAEPHNLAPGWVGVDFAKAFGKPVKVINDALMQAIGSYEGGRMLFLGLGTGLGSAMIVDNVPQPLEIAHLPFRKHTFEDYVSEAYRAKHGNGKWSKQVDQVVDALLHALEPDYVVLGGGNARRIKDLPAATKLGENANAFLGGFRIWKTT